MARSGQKRHFLTLGQMARANHMTEKSLRFYQQKGLLEPELVDDETGFRYYGILQSTKIDLINQLQLIGMSLEEIRQLSDDASIEALRAKALEQREVLAQKRKELELADLTAATMVAECDGYLNHPILNEVIFEALPPRWRLEFELPPIEEISMYLDQATDSDRWEWVIRYVKNRIIENGWPISLLRNVGYVAPVEALGDENLWSHRAFIKVAPEYGECFEHAKPFPSGTHLVLYVDQGYGENGDALDRDRFQQILAYAEEHGLEVSDDPFCESLCRFPRLFHQNYEALCRYCVPVRAKS